MTPSATPADLATIDAYWRAANDLSVGQIYLRANPLLREPLIHRLTYRRRGQANLHVRGFKEEGTTTTPFDMTVMNDLDRFHLVIDVAERTPRLEPRREESRAAMQAKLAEHGAYIRRVGDDMPILRTRLRDERGCRMTGGRATVGKRGDSAATRSWTNCRTR